MHPSADALYKFMDPTHRKMWVNHVKTFATDPGIPWKLYCCLREKAAQALEARTAEEGVVILNQFEREVDSFDIPQLAVCQRLLSGLG